MAKESENKAFYTSFCQHYNALFDGFFEEINEYKTSAKEEKKRAKCWAKCWLQPYIMLSICLERGRVSCGGLNDLDPVTVTTKTLDNAENAETLKELFNFDLKELQVLIDFLKQTQ